MIELMINRLLFGVFSSLSDTDELFMSIPPPRRPVLPDMVVFTNKISFPVEVKTAIAPPFPAADVPALLPTNVESKTFKAVLPLSIIAAPMPLPTPLARLSWNTDRAIVTEDGVPIVPSACIAPASPTLKRLSSLFPELPMKRVSSMFTSVANTLSAPPAGVRLPTSKLTAFCSNLEPVMLNDPSRTYTAPPLLALLVWF